VRAIVLKKFGNSSNLRLELVPAKTIKSEHDVLVEVQAAAVTSGDLLTNSLKYTGVFKLFYRIFYGVFSPRKEIRGISGAGIVKAVGSKVTRVKVGDRISFVEPLRLGSMAEDIVLGLNSVYAKIPGNMSFSKAAGLGYSGLFALSFANPQYVSAGMRVLVYGAHTPIGTYAVGIAKYNGANVTAVTTKGLFDSLENLGADKLITEASDLANTYAAQFDVVIDAKGDLPYSTSASMLALGGRSFTVNSLSHVTVPRLEELLEVVAKSKMDLPNVSTYLLEEFEDAFKKAESHNLLGEVVLLVQPEEKPVASKNPEPKPKPAAKSSQPKEKHSDEWFEECNLLRGTIKSPSQVEVLGVRLDVKKHHFNVGQQVQVAIHPLDLEVVEKGPIPFKITSSGFRNVTYTLKGLSGKTELEVLSLTPYDVGESVYLQVKPSDINLRKPNHK
jgi:NADPH:quinone reductase-like Zn-dependent oxidoreductase